MREPWYITNFNLVQESGMPYATNIKVAPPEKQDEIIIYIDGFVLPRLACHKELRHLDQNDLVRTLLVKYGQDFVAYLKGVFCLVILTPSGFQVYTDRHSVNNFLVYQQGGQFIVSNSLELIAKSYKLEPDLENAAVFTLLSHFVDGATQFKNLRTSTAAGSLRYQGETLESSNYWHPLDLLNPARSVTDQPFEHYAQVWQELAGQYLEFLKPERVSLTITAGNDSRMALSALLSLGVKPHTFTFGNPQSYEAVISALVAQAAGLEHKVYFVDEPNSKWMNKRSKDIIEMGNSLISIQRAHRYDAYESEHLVQPGRSMIFTGLMGGEYIKKPPPNSAALNPLLYYLAKNPDMGALAGRISQTLGEKGFKVSSVDIGEIASRLKSFAAPVQGLNRLEQDFIFLYLFYGCAHHTQESRILGSFFAYPVNLFMDVDFLEMLAGSRKWYLNNTRAYNRLTNSEFLVAITHNLAPQLSFVPYGKKGQYTADDMLNHKLGYTLKRLRYLFKKERNQYPPGFKLGAWMTAFAREQLGSLESVLQLMFDMQSLSSQIPVLDYKAGEYQWQVLSNPINLGLNYKRYAKV